MATTKTFLAAILLYTVLYPIAYDSPFSAAFLQRLRSLGKPGVFACEQPPYKTRIISFDPLIMHVENFITLRERQHLMTVGASLAKSSTVQYPNGSKLLSTDRTSSSAFVSKLDPIAQCVAERAAEFQGFEDVDSIESLQVTAYHESQQYTAHYDWYGPRINQTADRLTTFFAILDADCDNCGTQFPKIDVVWPEDTTDEKWCQSGILDCSSDVLVVNPQPGSALFWKNLHGDGSGDRRTMHSGMKLTRGYKTGLNIWTTQQRSQMG